MTCFFRRFAAIAVAVLSMGSAAHAEAPRVVTSIKPVHSLVSAVMAGVGEPVLLVKGGGSPHAYALRPSEARALNQARIVFWVSPGLEAFLTKPLASLAGKATLIPLSEAPGLTVLATREGGIWGDHEDDDHEAEKHEEEAKRNEHDDHEHEQEAKRDEHDGHEGEDHHHGSEDMHLWLDPHNAKAMVDAAAAALTAIDPDNGPVYTANARKTAERLTALDATLRGTLASLSDRGYLVYHDAYQYLERRYGLRSLGAVTATASHGVGAARLSAMRHLITDKGAVCVFSEPQFEPKLIEVLAEGTTAKAGVLDPLGAAIPSGPDHYFTLMEALGTSLSSCLAP